MDPRFTRVGKTIPDATFTGVEDDPIDDTADTRPALMGMVDVYQFTDVYRREE
jgi:hypothetical protein